MPRGIFVVFVALIAILMTACDTAISSSGSSSSGVCIGECGIVTHIVDGDTIDVEIDGVEYRVRYIGINTPERDEVCYSEATAANAALVEGQTVRLEMDTSETDPFGRLLRYVYVGDVFVNRRLVADGYAEAALYPPDDEYYSDLRRFEVDAARNNRGCHPTGIFDDNDAER